MRSSSIPIPYDPTVEELHSAIVAGFSYFNKKPPTVENKIYGSSSNRVPYVEGEYGNEWAWISVFKWPGNEKENDNCQFMCEIQSRVDDLFAALICFSLCKTLGTKIYDDAGYLSTGHEFTLTEFSKALQTKLDNEN